MKLRKFLYLYLALWLSFPCRRPRPQWRRRAAALAASAAVIYVVAATAASTDFSSAWTALGEQNGLALGILRGQLEGMWSGGTLPAGAALAIGQSPVLLSGREAVLELRRTEDIDHCRRRRKSGRAPPPLGSGSSPDRHNYAGLLIVGCLSQHIRGFLQL